MKNELTFSMGGISFNLDIPISIGKKCDPIQRPSPQRVPWGQQVIPPLQHTAAGAGQQECLQQVCSWGQQRVPSLQQTALGRGQQP